MQLQISTIHSTRRQFLGTAAAASLTTVGDRLGRLGAAEAPHPAPLAFYVVGDTHYLADKSAPSKIDATSAQTCSGLVAMLNRLPGLEIPAAAGGGVVTAPRGLIHAGDLIDTGDKQGGVTGEMQRTEWAAFADDYGLTGEDGRLKFPVYEVHGNHDSPHGKGVAIEKIIERNRRRPAVGNVSANGLHYSWDWGPAHFINLGLLVGSTAEVDRKRRYAALESLNFLTTDLRDQVGDSGRPVVITHHLDIARNVAACAAEAAPGNKEWDPCDLRAFHAALTGYNVAAIFYGHTHARNIFRWDGASAKAASGVNVFNTDNASHFNNTAQAFFYVELGANELTVREYQTTDRWQTGSFTPQVWKTTFA